MSAKRKVCEDCAEYLEGTCPDCRTTPNADGPKTPCLCGKPLDRTTGQCTRRDPCHPDAGAHR
jgi:hypothetical protein